MMAEAFDANINYPIGIQSFSEIIKGGYVYVDKTRYIPKLLKNGKFKFLSRPRRFGKSLLISTLEAFFKGERELFKGLAIDSIIPQDWESYPVIHIDLSGENYKDVEALENLLDSYLSRYEHEYDIVEHSGSASDRMLKLAWKIFKTTGKQIVVLIDEYDNPITSAIGNDALQEDFRNILYGFYSYLKKLDPYLKFCMLTGITKYGKLSVFSGLNNLMDISALDNFAGICGITEEELHSRFHSGIEQLACEREANIEETYAALKSYYDGYHFSDSLIDVYNPYSLLNALGLRKISDYWFQTGTPTILIKILKTCNIDVRNLEGTKATLKRLNDISSANVDPVALLFQTGYLTIKDYDPFTGRYTLGYPNKEIETGFLESVLGIYGGLTDAENLIFNLKDYLREGNPEKFLITLKRFFADIPFDLRKNLEHYENYYHSIFYVFAKLLGYDVSAEYHTSEGSIDMVITTDRYIYVIEFKINGSAETAMQQIDGKDYTSPFSADSRQIIKIGISFAEKTHTINDYLIKTE